MSYDHDDNRPPALVVNPEVCANDIPRTTEIGLHFLSDEVKRHLLGDHADEEPVLISFGIAGEIDRPLGMVSGAGLLTATYRYSQVWMMRLIDLGRLQAAITWLMADRPDLAEEFARETSEARETLDLMPESRARIVLTFAEQAEQAAQKFTASPDAAPEPGH